MANKERKDLNTTNGDLGNDYATSSVPISQRRGFFGTAMVWVGWCISLSAFLTGGTIGAGNTLWIGLLAVLAGNLLLRAWFPLRRHRVPHRSHDVFPV